MAPYRDDLQAALLRADEAERKLREATEKREEAKVETEKKPSRLRARWARRDNVIADSLLALIVLFIVGLIALVTYATTKESRERDACRNRRSEIVDYREQVYARDIYPGGVVEGKHCAYEEAFMRDGRAYVPCSLTVVPRGQTAPVRLDLWCATSCDEGRGCRAAEGSPK